MSKLGNYLKSEREKRGLSLHEIGLSLKINPKILAALEEGQKDNLPAKTFLRGFVKSYAQYLRLDANEALRLFLEEYGPARPEAPKGPSAPETAGSVSTMENITPTSLRAPGGEEGPREQSRLFLIAGGILLFVLVIFVAKMVDKYQKERATRPLQLEAALPVASPSPSASPAPVEEAAPAPESPTKAILTPPTENKSALMTPVSGSPAPTPAPSMTPIATPKPMATPVATPTPSLTPKPTPTPTPKPSPTPTPAATPTPTPTPKPTPSPSPTPAPSPSPTPSPSPSASPAVKPTEIILETLGKVTVKYTPAEGKAQVIELVPPQLHTFRAKGQATLELSDGGAVNLIVNGRDRGIPGSPGQPLKLTLP